MKKIYVDGSYDAKTKYGAFCLVIVDEDTGEKEWEIHRIDDQPSAYYVERAGIEKAIAWVRVNPETDPIRIYCDCLSAVKALKVLAKEAGATLRYIPGHSLGREGIQITEDLKRQHWADIMAYNFLKNVLDRNLSTSVI